MYFLYWESTEPAALHTTLGDDETSGGRTLQRLSPETSLALFPKPGTVAASPYAFANLLSLMVGDGGQSYSISVMVRDCFFHVNNPPNDRVKNDLS